MLNIGEWAEKWGISPEAIEELQRFLWATPLPLPRNGLSEAGVQSMIKLEASFKGCRLWRNNVGAFQAPDGAMIRFGLANESKSMNEQIKSADLIGIRPIKITQAHVGKVIGQFLSREAKAADWKYTATQREQAQLAWINLITLLGGDACFANREGTI